MAQELYTFDLQRTQLYEQVAERLQELIVGESLVSGDQLPGERDLAQRLGVSRTVVREAIRVLEVRGLIEVKPGCGTYVRTLTAENAAAPIALMLKLACHPELAPQLGEVRRMIEVEAAGLAAERALPEDIDALEACLASMRDAQDDPHDYTDQDLSFHLRLAQAAHNAILPLLLTPITNLLSEFIWLSIQVPEATSVGLGHHARLLALVRHGDAPGARQAMRDHLTDSERLVATARARASA